MKKSKRKSVKNPSSFSLFGRTKKRVTKKQKAAKMICVLILFAAVVSAVAGVMVVDHNSRTVGWGDNRTELAVAVYNDKADITVMGQQYYIETGLIKQANHIYGQICRGFDYLTPAPVRFVDMVYLYVKNKISNYI